MILQENIEKLKAKIEEIIDDLNGIFNELLINIQNVLNLDAVYSNVIIKLINSKDYGENKKNDIFDFGVKRIKKIANLIIQIDDEYKNNLPIILLREAFYCFTPQEITQNEIIRIIINLIVQFELEKIIEIDEWKVSFQEQFIELNINTPFFQTIDKFLRPDGSNLSENSISFFFNYIRNNVQLITEAKDTFHYDLNKEYILKTSRFIFDDDMVEAIRILIEIFYKVKKYRAFIDYKDYFKDFIQDNKSKTKLSLRQFSESVKWINKVSFIAPTYEFNLQVIDLSWIYCSLKFHPTISKKKIDRIINKFPLIVSPHSSFGTFSYEISFWVLYPIPYEKDIIHFIEKLEDFGYIVDKSVVLLREFKNNSINLNYFRSHYKRGRLINPKHPNYDDKYEISFENTYEFRTKMKKRELSILGTTIIENISSWAIEGIGFEARSDVNRLLKSRILHIILSQKNLIKNLKKKIRLIQDNNDIKQIFIDLLKKNNNFGFFYIKEYLEGIQKYLKQVHKILSQNSDIKNVFQFQEYIKKYGIFKKLDEAILFDRPELKKEIFQKLIPMYYNDRDDFKTYLKYINIISDFFVYCSKLKVFNIDAILRIIENRTISEKIYKEKQERLEHIRQDYKNIQITGKVVDEIIDEFCNLKPPIFIPYLVNTLNTSNFAKYYIRLFLKYRTETIKLLSKIKHYFPRFVFEIGIDPFTNKRIIYLAIFIVNLTNIEKEILLSIFLNLFRNEIVSIRRYFFDGFFILPDIRSYHDLDSHKWFYTKDLFEQYFNYVHKILGDKLKKFKGVPFNQYNLLFSSEKSINELIHHVEDRLSRQQIDFRKKGLKEIITFHSNLKQLICNIIDFKEVKKGDFFKKYVKSIKFLPDFHKYGISQYFLYMRPIDFNQIDFKLIFNNTFQKIKYPADISATQSLFINYLFPFRNPNMAYINWLTKSKRNINEYCIFFIKKIHVILNFYKNLESGGWSLDNKDFEAHIQHILFNPKFKEQPLEIKTFQLSEISPSENLGPDTPDFIKLNNIYKSESIDIKSIVGTKRYSKEKDIIDLLKKNHIFPYLKLKNLDFQDKIHIILVDLDKETIDKIIRVFNFFNYCFIYEIEGEYFLQGFIEEKKFENGLMIKIYLPLCEISAFLRLFRKAFHFLNIKDYLILNDLIDGKRLVKSVYGNLDFLKDYNPLKNLIWSQRDNKWLNHKLFNENFEPQYPNIISKEDNFKE